MPTPTGGLLRYPFEAITQTTDYLQIRAFKYQRNNLTGGPSGPLSGANPTPQAYDVSNYQSTKAKVLGEDGVIILPMPSNIQDSNSVSYESDSMNKFVADGLGVVQSTMIEGGKTLSDLLTGGASLKTPTPPPGTAAPTGSAALNKMKETIKNLLSNEARAAANTQLALSALNVFGANVSFNSLLARTDGRILNPNMELLFNNVTLRTFRFSFKLAPRDPREALEVKSIIRSLKKNMAVKGKSNGTFLETPNIFKLTYRKGNQNHPFLHRFKDCALSDMNVQYTGDNVYATYADGTPVSMILNLTFKELLPIYAEDYDNSDDYNNSGGSIGFGEPGGGNFIYGTGESGSTPDNSQNIEGVGF